MTNYEFWKNWKRKTKLEKAAIKSVKAAQGLILKNIPKKQIVSIYAKGSFVRREMNKNSDVDTVTIVKESKLLKKLMKLEEEYRNKYKPQIQFSGYSLWELKHNKRVASGKKLKANPSRAIQHLDNYRLFYGKKLKKENFYQDSPETHLRRIIFVFRNIFIPGYKEKKFGFSEIAKQVFWLVENEQTYLGKNPPHSWKKLAKTIKDKNHIIHDTLKYRLKPTK